MKRSILFFLCTILVVSCVPATPSVQIIQTAIKKTEVAQLQEESKKLSIQSSTLTPVDTTIPPTPSQKPTSTPTPTTTPSPTFTPTLTPTETPTPIHSSTPIRTSTPTKKPSPTPDYAKVPPAGTYCGANSNRMVCVGYIEYHNYLGIYAANANSRYISISVEVTNTGFSDINVNANDFTIVMSDGGTFGYDVSTFEYNQPLPAITVAPGNRTGGALVFLVLKDTAPARIICRSFLEDQVIIDLK